MNDPVKRKISNAVLQAVVSSQLLAIGYTAHDQVLTIQFPAKEGMAPGVYQYANFPPEKYDSFVASPSKGSFFAKVIRNAKDVYPYVKLSEAEIAEHIVLPTPPAETKGADDPGMTQGGINAARELEHAA